MLLVFEFEVERKIKDAAKGTAFMGDHCHWGQLEIWWKGKFKILPFHHPSKTFLYFISRFIKQALPGLWYLGGGVGSILECSF